MHQLAESLSDEAGRCKISASSWDAAGYREACNLAYKRLEEVSINNSANVKAFRQVRPYLYVLQAALILLTSLCRLHQHHALHPGDNVVAEDTALQSAAIQIQLSTCCD